VLLDPVDLLVGPLLHLEQPINVLLSSLLGFHQHSDVAFNRREHLLMKTQPLFEGHRAQAFPATFVS
jgi:hypothetical protein